MTGRYLMWLVLLLVLPFVAGVTNKTFAQGTAFTYQGRLQDGGLNANGSYDFQFTLWDALSGGTQQPQPSPVTVTMPGVAVSSGVFTVQLDFGATAFPGADRFLEMSVRLAGGGAFTLMTPRQPITSTPYAVRSLSASTVDTVPVGALPGGSGNYIQNITSQQASSNFNISGNGTVGGTLLATTVRATTQYRIGNFSDPVLSAPTSNNLFVGIGAGVANTAFNNTFVGPGAGRNNTSGANNAFFGAGAGVNNTTGSANSYFGFDTGGGNVGGASNSFFGYFAGSNNTSGNQNNFFGEASGANTTTGSFNSFFGNTTGVSNTVEALNSLLGSFADTAPGITNATAIGARAKVARSNSLVLGSIAGVNNGSDTNVGIGTTTPTSRLHVVGDTNLVGNLTVNGNLNAQLGTLSGNTINANTQYNIGGNRALGISGGGIFTNSNTFVGFGAGAVNTPFNDGTAPGNFNSFFGNQAGTSNTVGYLNSFFGFRSGASNTSGPGNSFFGYNAGLPPQQ